MTNNVIETMQARKAVLEAEKSKIDAEIQEIDAALGVIGKYTDIHTSSFPSSVFAPQATQKGLSKKEQILGYVTHILSDGVPRSTDRLLEELAARGIDVGGDNPSANLSAYLSRGKKEIGLISDRKFGWSFGK